MKRTTAALQVLASLAVIVVGAMPCCGKDRVPTSGKAINDSLALNSVLRVACRGTDHLGTAFLQKGGFAITDGGVARSCAPHELLLLSPGGDTLRVARTVIDTASDLALYILQDTTRVPTLPVGTRDLPGVGAHVSALGYPHGYNGSNPLVVPGVVVGEELIERELGRVSFETWVLSVTLNSGNTGGPVIDSSGAVIGVVVGKHPSLPSRVGRALQAFTGSREGFVYAETTYVGTPVTFTEGKIMAEALRHLRRHTPSAVAHVVRLHDLRRLLESHSRE